MPLRIPGRPRRPPKRRGRSDRAADRRGHAQLDRGRDRICHRAHRALADDPRGARLSRRPVRPPLPQADRPLLFGDAERGGARFSAGDDAAGRRVPDERHLSHRGLASAICPICAARCRCSIDGEVVAYIQAFGHHDDIGGRVPGSMPGTAATVFEEGLAIPPIKLYSAGVRNDAVFTIVRRNTRVPEMLAADLDSELQACLMGARRMAELFERFGTRDGRSLLPGHPRQVPRHLPQRAAAEDRRRRISLGRLRRARRRHRSQAAQARAEDDQEGTAGSRSTSPAPIRNRPARSTGRPTMPAAPSWSNGSRRSCAISPTRRSAPPRSTSTKASARSST